ncbi:MAG TPA: nucleoside phosphorylase [Clostridia bacterium]|nr:nucleoside phosphorylase [Clostridia bacterium]
MSKKILQPHIHLSIDDSAEFALLPGDPKRISHIAKFLDDVKELARNREYYSISGLYKGIKVLAISTGIGGPSTAIAVEELKNIGVKVLIRIGSCGALKEDLKKGDLVIATAAVRNDGTSKTYIEDCFPAVSDLEVLQALIESAKSLGYPYEYGIIKSHDSFYTDKEEEINNYWSEKGVIASDMETASLFVVGSLRGLKTGSILNVVVEKQGNLKNDIAEYAFEEDKMSILGEEREILTALNAIVKLKNLL